MSIGSKIKALRRANDLTQEKLAEHLGISSKAVSQWECDRTAPDISQLPALCNFFNITADELLGIDLQQKEKRISDIRDSAKSYDSRGYKSEAYKILSQGLREFPNSYDLMRDLMNNAFYLQYDGSYSEEERKNFTTEVIRLGNQILENCLVDDHRYSAIQTLCLTYSQNGNQDCAAELAKKLPTLVVSREFMNSHIYSGDEGYECDKALISHLVIHIVTEMQKNGRKDNKGNPFYTDAEKTVLRDKTISFLSLIYENGDYGFCNCYLAQVHTTQASYYAQQLDIEKTLEHLALAAEHATAFVEYAGQDTFVHTSLLLRGYKQCGKSFMTTASDNDALILLNYLSASKYDFIRNTEEFKDIIEKLKKYAAKWNPTEKHLTNY